MEENDVPEVARKPWGKWIGMALGAIVVILVLVFFIATSSPFIKGFILPKAGAAMNAKITAGDISLSPFSQLDIRQLKVETTGAEPLLSAEEVRVRYSLMDILKGNIKVDELTLTSPVINIVQEADGTSNLDPLTQGPKKAAQPKSKEPTKLAVQNISLKNGIIRQSQKAKDGSSQRTELQGVNITLDRLGNGQMGHLQLATSFALEQKQGQTNSTLSGQVSGGYDISLNSELMPDTLKGAVKLTVARADGSFKELNGFNGSLDADLTPKEIRQIALKFARNDQPLGQVRVSGPLDLDKKEGNLKLIIDSIDKNVLGLAAAGKGYDFGNSQINSTNQITIAQAGSFFSAAGNLAATRVTLAQGAAKTPELNLNVEYQVSVNATDKSAILQKLNLSGAANGSEFLRSELDRQMNVSWGTQVKGYRDAGLKLVVTNLNVADWQAVAGTNISAGVANVRLAIVSQQDGKLLNIDLAAQVNGLNAKFGTNQLSNAGVTLESTGTVEQFKVINLPRYSLALRQNDAQVLQANGSARYVLDSKESTAQLSLEAPLARLLALAPMPDAKAANGTLKAAAKYSDDGSKRSAVGNLGLADFTGNYQAYAFTNFNVGLEYNIDVDKRDLTLNRTALTVNQGFNRGGTVEIKGKYSLENKGGQFNFSTVDLNQNLFGPVLAPSLGDNQLVSISLNASGEAKLDPQAESSIKADLSITNWVVQDKAGKLPKTPLAMSMKVDGGMKKEAVDLRQFLLQLSPTPRAKNALLLQAKLDLAKTNPAPSTLTLSSESLDLTPYYEMFAGKSGTNATAAKTGSSAPAPAPAQPQTEPAAMQLPFQQFTADLKIDRLYLRDVAISNWVGKVAIRSNVVQINPFQLQMNGAPMNLSGTVNVGLPGYIYDMAFKADSVPLAPLVNSFGNGQTNLLQGNFVADAQIRGAGTTGPNLRKNLGGNLNLNLTNLNYQIIGPKLRRVIVPISIALQVPQLPDSPIDWVSAQTDIGNGVVTLKHLGVESAAFYAESAGTITLADVLTNSTLNLPLDLSLNRTLAQNTKIAQADNSTNASKYVKLTRFASIKGTLGAPETDINKLALAGMALKGVAALGLGDGKAGQALGSVGNLLTGQGSGANAAGTNTAAGVVQGIGSLLGNKPATNSTAAATNDTTSSLVRGLGGLLSQPAAATNATKVDTNAVVTNAVQNALDSLLRPKTKKK